MAEFGALKDRELPAWYATPQLGVFIHWGVFAVPAWAPRGASITELSHTRYDELFALAPYAEWYANALRIPGSPTRAHHTAVWGERTYESFRPDFERAAAAFDAETWADLFAAVGARYVVFVAKHHDGYCLWPTRVENPRRPGWRSERDFAGELAEAVRARGLRFGVYYSGGLDWTFKDDPIVDLGDMFACTPTSADYVAYAEAQVRELIDRYRPSVLWNDIAWPDAEGLPQLFADYYSAVPEGVVNDRWTGGGRFARSLGDQTARKALNDLLKARLAAGGGETPPPPHCDFRTVEYAAEAPAGGRKWEATRGLGLAFGYNANEETGDYLTGEGLAELYREVTAGGGNLLINVGPRADGSIPEAQAAPLRTLGARLRS
ncbi:MAG: alpha-L-fucosidase [Caulobacteraceae bacterium]